MKILLVDDEVVIHEYIANCIAACGPEYEVAACVERADDALAFLAGHRVDLVLADITMPQKNGLVLLEEIKAAHPSVDVVMLTCHSSFEYARQALNRNAEEYLLKSEVNPAGMKRLLDAIAAKRRSSNTISSMSVDIDRAQYLRDVLANDGVDALDAAQRLRHNIQLEDFDFVALAIPYTQSLFDVLASYQDLWLKNQLIFVYNNRLVFVTNIVEQTHSRDGQQALVTRLVEKIRSMCDGPVGVSRVFRRADEVKSAILEALYHMDERFFGRLPTTGKPPEKTERLATQNEISTLASRAVLALYDGRLGQYREQLEQLLELAAARGSMDVDHLKETLCFIAHAAGAGGGPADSWDWRAQIEAAMSFAQLRSVMEELSRALESRAVRYSEPIETALQYIAAHYSHDISLGEVAEQVYLNKEYFSRRFKSEVGLKFSEYVLSTQLKEAYRLLTSTAMKIREVAEAVGIPNISYFSVAFKKMFGCSPSEARSSGTR